jgi:hypothetical protein
MPEDMGGLSPGAVVESRGPKKDRNEAVFFGLSANATTTMDDTYPGDWLRWLATKYCDMKSIQKHELDNKGR